MVSREICRICLNYSENQQKFNDSILQLLKFLVVTNKFFPQDYIDSLLIHETNICSDCVKCVNTVVSFKKTQTSTYDLVTKERRKLHVENLSLNRMSIFTSIPCNNLVRACCMCLHLIIDGGVYLYNNSKNVLPPHIVRSMLMYCRLHLSSHIINPILCSACWENLQLIYNFKKSSDEIENLIRFYCEANNQKHIVKGDLDVLVRIHQHEKNRNNTEDILEKYTNNNPKVNKVIGTVNNTQLPLTKINETSTVSLQFNSEKGQFVETTPKIRIESFATITDTEKSSNIIDNEENNTNTQQSLQKPNNIIHKEYSNTEPSSNVYSEILNRELFGPINHVLTEEATQTVTDEPVQTDIPMGRNNVENISKNNLHDYNINNVNRPPSVAPAVVEASVFRVKQEILSDEEVDNTESQANIESLINVERFENNLFDTDFEMDLSPPLLEVEEPFCKDLKPTFNQNGAQQLSARYSCDQCDFTTMFVQAKKNHTESHKHNTIKLHSCSHCDFKTTRKLSLKKHKSVHSNKSTTRAYKHQPSPSTSRSLLDQPPLLEIEQPNDEMAFNPHLSKEGKQRVVNLERIATPEVNNDRPVIYRTIGTPKHKRLLKIIGYLENGTKVFGSSHKRDEKGRIITEAAPDNKPVRRSCRVNPLSVKASNETRHDRQEQNKKQKQPPKIDAPKFKCDLCDFSCHKQRSLNSHVASHKSNTLVLHYCVQCDYTTTKKSALKVHHKIHLEEDGLVEVSSQKKRGRRTKLNPKSEYSRLPKPSKTEFLKDLPDLDVYDAESLRTELPRRVTSAGPPVLEAQVNCNEFLIKPCKVMLKKENLQEQVVQYFKYHGTNKMDNVIQKTSGIFSCKQCNFTTTAIRSMTKHEYGHMRNILNVFECDRCDYKICSKRLFQKHISEHNKQAQAHMRRVGRRKKDTVPEMPVLTPDNPSMSYDTKADLIQEFKRNQNQTPQQTSNEQLSQPSGSSVTDDHNYVTRDNGHDVSQDNILVLGHHDILRSAAKTYEDSGADFESFLMKWFEEEILTNKTFGIQVFSQILKGKG